MSSQKITFKNSKGQDLAARLELPDHGEPKAFAIFAHCFTCNKNLTAVRTIGKTLIEKNIAVLRFDFTGLGESEGDFQHTNFSSNVEDLYSAAAFLEENYQAPKLLIGHSLGGAAVLAASVKIPTAKAIVTIGASSNPEHVSHLFKSSFEEINSSGKALVSIGGRDFTIQKQFLDDIQDQNIKHILDEFRNSILIMHSPQDTTVSIDNAADIYKAARHPKSFISLNGADHLLSDKKDSEYVGHIIATWADRYL
ncbi:alpha/beta hydrolase family protein [Flavobacterium algicola]|uniref:alpha/beta hydrolase family protein n=1 Tax=Flavobacterium algicola TaxID=556529 RepID=UPI001EFDDFD2|nr:alpha/beta hydrolase [Flavobacterium algicola]MCG9793394.1 alpha/beta hydrolase [Flavobacterium algicola]